MKFITARSCGVTYEYLSKLAPFRQWILPPVNEVQFAVKEIDDCYGEYNHSPHIITISTAKVGHLDTLIRTMAHEMIHLHLFNKGFKLWDLHGSLFARYAKRVSVTMGFDPKEL